jgi:hypothetical protein
MLTTLDELVLAVQDPTLDQVIVMERVARFKEQYLAARPASALPAPRQRRGGGRPTTADRPPDAPQGRLGPATHDLH